MSRGGETCMHRTLRPHAGIGWWPEGAKLPTPTSRHRDMPLGILGTLASGDPAAKLGPAQTVPVHASRLPDQQCSSAWQRPGEPGQLEVKAKNLNLTLQPSSSSTLPLGQRATPFTQGYTQVRQGSWVPQGRRGSPRVQAASPGQGMGRGRWGGAGDRGGLAKWTGLMPTSPTCTHCRVHPSTCALGLRHVRNAAIVWWRSRTLSSALCPGPTTQPQAKLPWSPWPTVFQLLAFTPARSLEQAPVWLRMCTRGCTSRGTELLQ